MSARLMSTSVRESGLLKRAINCFFKVIGQRIVCITLSDISNINIRIRLLVGVVVYLCSMEVAYLK